MSLNIKDREAHELARTLAERRGTTLTEAVKRALREAVQRSQRPHESTLETLDEISLHCASLPVQDDRSAEEILGYDEAGMPR